MSGKYKKTQKGKKELEDMALYFLAGTNPSIPDTISEVITQWPEKDTDVVDQFLSVWIRLQQDEVREIGGTLREVLLHVKSGSKRVRDRIESPEYLRLVKKAFRNWSAAENETKRIMIRNLLVNAASLRTSPDHALEMFIDWIDSYSDDHFSVIRETYLHPGITRRRMWLSLHDSIPPEDSAEADMYKLLIMDLTTGYVIRQKREKDYYGNFVKRKSQKRRVDGSSLTSTFDNEKKYVLTELGRQFVHYTIEELPHE